MGNSGLELALGIVVIGWIMTKACEDCGKHFLSADTKESDLITKSYITTNVNPQPQVDKRNSLLCTYTNICHEIENPNKTTRELRIPQKVTNYIEIYRTLTSPEMLLTELLY